MLRVLWPVPRFRRISYRSNSVSRLIMHFNNGMISIEEEFDYAGSKTRGQK